jgi:hypothetical protein
MAMKLSAELFNEIISSLRSDGGTNARGHEKRKQGRVGLRCGLDITLCSFTSKNAKPLSICVHDISQNGIGLVSATKLPENSEFVARFVRDAESAVPVLYKVRYCSKLSGDLFTIGAMFQRVLPDASGEIISLGKKGKAGHGKLEAEKPVEAVTT